MSNPFRRKLREQILRPIDKLVSEDEKTESVTDSQKTQQYSQTVLEALRELTGDPDDDSNKH